MRITSLKVLLLFGVLLLGACAVKSTYQQAIFNNTESAYLSFLTKYPNSKYAPEIINRLDKIKDEKEWSKAQLANTIASYQTYLTNQNMGAFSEVAYGRLEKLKAKEIEDAIWKEAQGIHSIEAYTNFIETYPSSGYGFAARQSISALQDSMSWEDALVAHTIGSYGSYLTRFPSGKYATAAKTNIAVLQEEETIKPLWEEAVATNTYAAYKTFSEEYGNSSYAKMAFKKMEELDDTAWRTASQTNTIAAYNMYLRDIIDGNHELDANRKIIDLEVDMIFKGAHGKLPPMQKIHGGEARNATHTTVEIQNDTPYLLTVLYSGDDSKKVEILAGKKALIRLKMGTYRIAASVKASHVSNYVGTEDLGGYDYRTSYYIETKRVFR